MKFKYSRRATPPELVVPVVVAAMEGSLVYDAEAKIDTAADISTITTLARKHLGLVPEELVTVRGARGEKWDVVPTYRVRIRIAGDNWLEVRAVESPRNYMLVGRNILNQYILIADGPAEVFELALPSI